MKWWQRAALIAYITTIVILATLTIKGDIESISSVGAGVLCASFFVSPIIFIFPTGDEL